MTTLSNTKLFSFQISHQEAELGQQRGMRHLEERPGGRAGRCDWWVLAGTLAGDWAEVLCKHKPRKGK